MYDRLSMPVTLGAGIHEPVGNNARLFAIAHRVVNSMSGARTKVGHAVICVAHHRCVRRVTEEDVGSAVQELMLVQGLDIRRITDLHPTVLVHDFVDVAVVPNK